jgi:hypothetical protein
VRACGDAGGAHQVRAVAATDEEAHAEVRRRALTSRLLGHANEQITCASYVISAE